MTTIRRTPIKSSSKLEDPRLWFPVEFDPAKKQFEVREGNYRGKAVLASSKPAAAQLAQAWVDAQDGRKEEWVLWLGLDESLNFTPSNQMPPLCLAHLGIYRPWLDELELLDFIEE